jgi:hypothetical protein
MSNLLKGIGGIMEATLGKQPCRFLRKNPVPHIRISKRRFNQIADLKLPIPDGTIICRGGGYLPNTHSGKVGKVGRTGKFPENFIGAGFCDG